MKEKVVLSVQILLSEDGNIEIVNPNTEGALPARLLFNLMKAVSDVEQEWNKQKKL